MRPFALLLAAVPLLGAPLVDAATATRPGGAEVRFVSSTTAVDDAGVEHELDTSRFLLDYSEEATDWLSLGFTLGLSFDGMQSHALVAASDPSGYALGVFANARLFEAGPFALDLEFRHLRDFTEGGDGTSDTTLDFYETEGRLGASWRFSGLEVEAGAFTLKVEGEIESTGVVVGTAEFAEVEQAGSYAALRLPLKDGFALGLLAEQGARETLAFTFSARF